MGNHPLKVETHAPYWAKVGDRYAHGQEGGFWFSFGEIAQYFYEHRGRVAQDIDGVQIENDKAIGGLLYQVLMELKDLKEFAESIVESPGVKRAMRLSQMRCERKARKIVRDRIAAAERIHGRMPENVRRVVRKQMRRDGFIKDVMNGNNWGVRWVRLPFAIGGDKSKVQIAYAAWKKRRVSRKRKLATP